MMLGTCHWVLTSFSTLRLQMKRIDGDEKLMTELKAADKHRFGVEFSEKGCKFLIGGAKTTYLVCGCKVEYVESTFFCSFTEKFVHSPG